MSRKNAGLWKPMLPWVASVALLSMPPFVGEAHAQSRAAAGNTMTDDEVFEIWTGGIFKKSMEYASEEASSPDSDVRSAFKGHEEQYASCMKERVTKTPGSLRSQLISYLRNTLMAGKSKSLFPDTYNNYWLNAQNECLRYIASDMLAK